MVEITNGTITLEQVAKLMFDARMRVEPVRHGIQDNGGGAIVARLVSQADATQVPVLLASLFVHRDGKEEIRWVSEKGFEGELNTLTTLENEINAGFSE